MILIEWAWLAKNWIKSYFDKDGFLHRKETWYGDYRAEWHQKFLYKKDSTRRDALYYHIAGHQGVSSLVWITHTIAWDRRWFRMHGINPPKYMVEPSLYYRGVKLPPVRKRR